LKTYFESYRNDLTETSRKRLDTNPLRILDTKEESERTLLVDAPRLIDFIDDESRRDFDEVQSLLADLGISYREDHFLVRGLDYYTRTAFELESPDLGAQSALAGGGRYDLLAQELGSKHPVPAVGFAAGMERLFLALQAHGVPFPEAQGIDVFMVALGDEAVRWTFNQSQQLRRDGFRVGLDLKGRSMKAQMREANRQRAPFAVIVGNDELGSGVAQLKDMVTGAQSEIAVSNLSDTIRTLKAAEASVD
jgi:histidyl-tRNA synthetase